LRDNVALNPDFVEQNRCDLCASLLHTVVDILVDKLIRAAKEFGIKDIALGGGVSANSALRARIEAEGRKRGWRTFLPELQFTTDNAAMIAVAGYYRYLQGEFSSLDAAPIARYEDLV
jgi:N6-L-threonylcarbamoyladenine synthase